MKEAGRSHDTRMTMLSHSRANNLQTESTHLQEISTKWTLIQEEILRVNQEEFQKSTNK
jgi:hypothetical protein